MTPNNGERSIETTKLCRHIITLAFLPLELNDAMYLPLNVFLTAPLRALAPSLLSDLPLRVVVRDSDRIGKCFVAGMPSSS